MQDQQIARILHRLCLRDAQEAWAEFLQIHSPLILQVVRFFERDADRVADCFLFVCEQLSRKRFRRLRRFRLKGPASFPTWLRAVVRNLCLDWHRQEFGRQRIFQSIERLPAVDRELFRFISQEGRSLEETFLLFKPRFPTLSREQVEESFDRIRQSLTPRQLWLLSVRRTKLEPLGSGSANQGPSLREQIPAPGPDPESLAALNERRAALARALSRLPRAERLLIRLRFEQELTLEQVAQVTKLADAQSADRRIHQILERLRKEVS